MSNEMILLDNVTPQALEKSMAKIKQFQQIIKNSLIEGVDYGTIPGCGSKPTLLNPGAQKTLRTFNLRPFFDVLSEIEDFEKGLFFYKIKSRIFYGDEEIAQGIGSCNSWEDKYRYRWVFESDIPSNLKKENLVSKTRISKNGKPYKVYKVPNDDMATQVNTILKMAKKRALVDVSLFIASLSDIFTQDIEDNPDYYANNNVETEGNNSNNHTTTPTTTKPATQKQLDMIFGYDTEDGEHKKGIVESHLIQKKEVDKIQKLYSEGKLDRSKASEVIGWWIGDKKKGIEGERDKRENEESLEIDQEIAEEEGNTDFDYGENKKVASKS